MGALRVFVIPHNSVLSFVLSLRVSESKIGTGLVPVRDF